MQDLVTRIAERSGLVPYPKGGCFRNVYRPTLALDYLETAGCRQAARLAGSGAWALCGCTVAPGFEFADFELPPADALGSAYPHHEQFIRQLTRR